ncbi:MAG: hypothetical protein OXG09_08400 [Chloroflexi bacterium]|nr:hypothetical protein [Chloroflexota bacterium]
MMIRQSKPNQPLIVVVCCILWCFSVGYSSAQDALFEQDDLKILYGNVQRPNGMVWHNDKLYVACSGDWTIYEINLEKETTRTYIFGVQNANSLFAEFDAEGVTQLWVPDFVTHELLNIHPRRRPTTVIDRGLAGAWGIAFRDEGQFLISNLLADSIVSVSRAGKFTTLVQQLRSPTGLVLDGGVIYVANTGSVRRSIEWFTLRQISAQDQPLNATQVEHASLVQGLQNVTGLTLSADGWLYFAYSAGEYGEIGRVNPHHCRDSGGCQAEDVEVVVQTALPAPIAGLTLSPDGRLYFHSLYKPEIYWLQLPQDDRQQVSVERQSDN